MLTSVTMFTMLGDRILFYITKTSPCTIQIIFSVAKLETFIENILIFLIFLLKTIIVGAHYNCLDEAVLTITHNLCFGLQTGMRLSSS